jgi:nuclear GTP-binding protein
MKRIYLIDCPGVVPPSNNDSEQDILLRGVVRVENVEHPEQYIAAVLAKTKPQHIERTYDVRGYNNPTEFLELLARKGGRLLKGGEADVDGVAKMVLNDFLRGKIPWYTPPPIVDGDTKGIEGRGGRLGEMGKKRKREDDVSTTVDGTEITGHDTDEFEGFGVESEDGIEDESDGGSPVPSDAEESTDDGHGGADG